MSRTKTIYAAVSAAALVVTLAACGSSGGGGGSGGNEPDTTALIKAGTTEQVTSFDPAGSFDQGSYLTEYSLYQNLLYFPAQAVTPQPDAAKSCEYTNPKTLACELQPGLTFSNGDELTSSDVKFSFQRQIKIADTNGPSSLLGSLRYIETPDPTRVIFHLKQPDATFKYIIATGAGFIVDEDVFPADSKLESSKVIGSGPYYLASYKAHEQTALKPNDKYAGPEPAPVNGGVLLQYYAKSTQLRLALQENEIDLVYRTLTPTDVSTLEGDSDVKVLTGAGAEIRYFVFNLKLMPGDNPAQKLAIRRAVALTVDREAIAQNVYKGTVEPLWSMVPPSFDGAEPAFQTEYGDKPDKTRAKGLLNDAGVSTPVDLEIWYTPTRYGDLSADEYTEIKRSLEESGLFTVTLKNTEWEQYSTAAFTDHYPIYHLGWFPDYPDADDYVASFYSKDSFLNHHYVNPQVEAALATEKAETEQSARVEAFKTIQDVTAKDVPIIPIWLGKQLAASRTNVDGVQETLDANYIFRFWLVSKS